MSTTVVRALVATGLLVGLAGCESLPGLGRTGDANQMIAGTGCNPGQNVCRVDSAHLVEFVQACRDAGFEMFIDITAVDYYRQRPGPRFELVVGLLSMSHNLRIRILVGVDGEVHSAPSITGVYPGANFYEREVYDLFGITFTGHPDLTRIMLPDD